MIVPAHDRDVLAVVRAGRYRLDWIPIDCDGLYVEVTADALRLDDGLRPSTTPLAAQLIADELGAALLTPLLADHVYLAADARLTPHPQPIVPGPWRCPDCGRDHSGPWARCQPCGEREHSRAIDAEIAGLEAAGRLPGRTPLLGTVGKPWALARSCFARPGRIGQPYGWYSPRAKSAAVTRGLRLIQPCRAPAEAAPHDGAHIDYAEPWRGWRPVGRSFAALWADPIMLRKISNDGPPGWRLPGGPLTP